MQLKGTGLIDSMLLVTNYFLGICITKKAPRECSGGF